MTIRSKAATKEYRDGWDRVFGRKRKDDDEGGFLYPNGFPVSAEDDALLRYRLAQVDEIWRHFGVKR